MNKKLKPLIGNSAVIALPVLLFFFFFIKLSNVRKEKLKREDNSKVTIGQVIKRNSGKRPSFLYQYFVEGKAYRNTISGNDLDIKMYAFYDVEFEKGNPLNSELLIANRKQDAINLLPQGIPVNGQIERVSLIENYVDVYVKYTYSDNIFSFRTRLHRDSLPCGRLEDCKKDDWITLKVYSEYPLINNLYFRSHDRQLKNKVPSRINVLKH